MCETCLCFPYLTIPYFGALCLTSYLVSNSTEYVALIGSFFLVGFEALIRVLTLALPNTLITLFYRLSRRLFNRWTTPAQKRAEERRQRM